jgi:hypothetical protein
MASQVQATRLSAAPARDYRLWIGRAMSALTVAFLLMDATMKLLALPVVLDAGAPLGFAGAGVARGLGTVLLICTLLYVAPRTAVLGAILLTAYLGGAVATQLRVGSPLFTHVLFGVYLGAMVWGGLALRDVRMGSLIPLRNPAQLR